MRRTPGERPTQTAVRRIRNGTSAPPLLIVSVVLAVVTGVGAVMAGGSIGESASTRHASYIVMLDDSVENPRAIAKHQAAEHGARLTHVYRSAVKGYAAVMSKGAAEEIAGHSVVANVEADLPMVPAGQGTFTPEGPQTITNNRRRSYAADTREVACEGKGTPNPKVNQQIDIDCEDDKRVDVDVAILDTGIGSTTDLNVQAHIDCAHPDDPDGAPEATYIPPPDSEHPQFDLWMPNERLNETYESEGYGCLENDGVFPVAAYSFDEGSGEVATDMIGSNDGQVEGAVWTPNGKYGSALEFDGTDAVVSIADHTNLDLTDEFTLEAWVKPEAPKVGLPVISKMAHPPLTGYGITAQNNEGVPAGSAHDGSLHSVEGTSPLAAGAWAHLAFTSDGEHLRLYVDGELVGTTAAGGASANGSDLQLGHNQVFGTYFEGLIDEVRIYDETLSEEQIEDDRDVAVAEDPGLSGFGEGTSNGDPYYIYNNHNGSHGAYTGVNVAGIDNEVGYVGVAPGARLWSVKVFDVGRWGGIGAGESDADLELSAVIAGVDWVYEHADEIEVVAMSLGCQLPWEGEGEDPLPTLTDCSTEIAAALNAAVDATVAKGIVFVGAAGEMPEPLDVTDIAVPLDNPNVLITGVSTDSDGAPSYSPEPAEGGCAVGGGKFEDVWDPYVNYGRAVRMAAPYFCHETSQAAPQVAGAAAILASRCNPSNAADAHAIMDTLIAEGNTDVRRHGGWDDTSGDGHKESLLDVSNEAVFDPKFVGEEQATVDCDFALPSPRIEAENYPATLASDGFSFAYAGEEEVQCESSSLNGQIASASEEASFGAEYNGCLILDTFPTDIQMNSCRYVFDMQYKTPPLAATLDIACAKEGDAVEYDVYLGEGKEVLLCTAEVGPQSGLTGISLQNTGKGGERAVALNANVEGVHYTQSGPYCNAPGAHDDGALTVETTLEGTDEAGGQVGIYIEGGKQLGVYLEGEKSESPPEQPMLKADGYPKQVAAEGTGGFVTSGEGAIECESVSLQGELPGGDSSLLLDAEYGECLAAGTYPTDVHMNSCHYTLDVQNAGPPYKGSLGVACAEEGDAIEFKTYLGEEKGVLVCTTTLGPQSGLGGLDLSNVGEASERAIEVDAAVEGVEYESSGLSCDSEGTKTGGRLNFDVVLGNQDEVE